MFQFCYVCYMFVHAYSFDVVFVHPLFDYRFHVSSFMCDCVNRRLGAGGQQSQKTVVVRIRLRAKILEKVCFT